MGKKKDDRKTTFWPMAGGITEGFANYLAILQEIEREAPSRKELVDWVAREYALQQSYAGNIVTMLILGPRLAAIAEGKCVLTPNGRDLIRKSSATGLYDFFRQEFIGISDLLRLVGNLQPVPLEDLSRRWHESMMQTHQLAWKTTHAKMQFKHRLDFLRSLQLINKVADSYFLSKTGMEVLSAEKREEVRTEEEIRIASHNEIEDKLRQIGSFFEFMSIKRASVNDARPAHLPKLKEDRQLDCLWARVINFGGKVQYAFEVQISGSVSDAIERLEMVALFVQKAVVVTDEGQAARIRERLEIKHSPLRDKIVFLSYEDVNVVAEAVSALSVFTGRLFRD